MPEESAANEEDGALSDGGRRPSRKGSGVRAWWGRRSGRAKGRLIFYPGLLVVVVGFLLFTLSMPGRSYRSALSPLDDGGRSLAITLERDVASLAGEIGERNMTTKGTLERASELIESRLRAASYAPRTLRYDVDGRAVANIEATQRGTGTPEIVVIGAHYDTAMNAPGADDNASGVAALLALARAFEQKPQRRTLRFVAFVNEEPPHFWNESMGSLHYARACKDSSDVITAMLSLESLGYYRDEAGSQKYPPIVSWFFPDRANFVAFVGNLGSRSLVRESIGAFRTSAQFPSEGAALPSFVTGVGWSDQWSFWQLGYPGVMVTDTAPFRNPNYHTPNDKPATLDYERLARVTLGLVAVVETLAR